MNLIVFSAASGKVRIATESGQRVTCQGCVSFGSDYYDSLQGCRIGLCDKLECEVSDSSACTKWEAKQ